MAENVKNEQPPYRYIHSDLKTKKLAWEIEHPVRWSYMKILREHSDLKEFYPDIDPYVEAYKMRDNVYAMYSESLDGHGDPWMYLIIGPEKNMLIDTGFGAGDLKGLVQKLGGDKPLIVVNTHSHGDHSSGNGQFDRIYCHKYEVPRMENQNRPGIWDKLFDENGDPKHTIFDKNDLIEWHPYEIVGVDNGYTFDLGDGYEVELVFLPGHTPGQCGYLDHYNNILFMGDTTSVFSARPGEAYGEYCSVEALRDSLIELQPRFESIEGVFPGHGMLDQSYLVLQYLLDAASVIVADPMRYDEKRTRVTADGRESDIYVKYIYQGTGIRYSMDAVYKSCF